MTGRPCAAIGFTPVVGRRQGHRSSGAVRKIRPAWVFIPTGRGHGQRIGACFITALPATQRASLGIRPGSRYGGTKRLENGPAMTYLTLSPTPIRRITWD